MLEFSVLGPLRVSWDECDVPIARPKSRGLLGLLVARVGHRVATDQLIDELWVREPPASAESAFRVHLAFLRNALRCGPDDAPGPIEATGGGYRLAVAPECVDAWTFEAAVARGRDAWTAGAAGETVALLERALTRRRGPAYADLLDLEPLRDESVRLERLWLTGVELLADAYLALGRPAAVCELLPGVIALHPLRESLTERLMLGLYREGRQADAMRAFSELREALDRELGFEPNPTVRALEEDIILQRAERDPVRRDHPQPRLELRESDTFAGRRIELETIDRVWADVLEGGPRLVLIGGPAGIGKSTLAQQAAKRAAEAAAIVVAGTCDPDPVSDYEPLPEVVRALVDLAPPALLRRPLLGELTRLAPDLAERLPAVRAPADASAGRHRLFLAVDELLAGIHAVAPVLVIAEDLQWSGPDALALLRHLVRNATGPVMVIGTYRDDDVGPDSPLAEFLSPGRLSRAEVIHLTGLSTTELHALVQATAPDDLRRRALARLEELRDVTMGNPLYALEVLRELAATGETGEIAQVAPDGVRSIMARRLVRLSPETRTVLAAGAVLGRDFSLELLARTTRMSESTALDAVDEAIAARLLEETGELDHFAFSHPLFRNTLYNDTPASRRARLHLDAARALEAASGAHGAARPAELAHHFLAALPLGDAAQAAQHALAAGDDAAAAFAHAEAAAWYRRAIALATEAHWDARQQATALLALGECLERAGQRDNAREAFLAAAEYARNADDAPLVADVAIASTPRYVTLDDFHDRHTALVDEALATSISDPRRRAWLLNSAAASHYYGTDRGDELYAKQALALAREWSDPEVQAAGLATYRRWLTHDAVRAFERLEVSRELIALCREHRLDRLIGQSCRNLLVDLMETGELDEFDAMLEEFAVLADAHGLPADIYWLSALRATRALMRAPDAYTEELVNAACTLGRGLQQWDADGTFVLQVFALRYQQDRVREIREGLETPQPASPRVRAGVAILAAALVACDRADAARPIIDRALEGGKIVLPDDNLWLGAVALLSGAVAVVGTSEQRELLASELAPFSERWCIFGAGGAVFGTGHHWLGRLARAQGEHERAARHFDAAAELSDAAGAPYWAEVARTDRETVAQPV